jgi:hypothetical protein
MNPKAEELITILVDGTKKGTFEWGATPEKGTYRLMFHEGLIRISIGWGMGTSNSISPAHVVLTVLNKAGDVMVQEGTLRTSKEPLSQLYDDVKNRLETGALDSLLQEVRRKAGVS